MVSNILNAIGNVLEAHEIDGVLFTLAADAVIRTNDIDTGFIVARLQYRSQAAAAAAFATAVAKAQALAAPAPAGTVRVRCTDCHAVTILPAAPPRCPICGCPRICVEPIPSSTTRVDVAKAQA